MLAQLAFLFLTGFSTILKWLPPSVILKLGHGLGFLLSLVRFRHHVISDNLKLALSKEKSPEELKKLTAEIYANVGTLFLEIARNFTLQKPQMIKELHVDPEDLAFLEDMKTKKQGGVFISGHIANWELMACGMAARGFPVSIVGKRMSDPISQKLIEQRRKNTSIDIIYTGNTLEKMKEKIKNGQMIGFMVDQHIQESKGVRCDFFGTPASSIKGLAHLVKEIQCPLIPICVFRNKDGTHHFKMLKPLPYISLPPESQKLYPQGEEWLNTQLYQATIEKLVRLNLPQWLWIHRRWKADRTPLSPSEKYSPLSSFQDSIQGL